MKNLSLIMFAAICIVSSIPCAAQIPLPVKKPGITLGFAAYYAKPLGNFRDSYKGGVGGEVKGGIGLGKTYLVGTLGYAAFAAASGNNAGTLTVKPMMLGLKRYFLLKRLFIAGDAGVAVLKNKNFTESRFTGDIGAGVRLAGLEVSMYYDTWKNISGKGYSNSMQYKLGYNLTL